MSKFDFDLFTGDYPIVVSKERYTEQQAEEIAKNISIHSLRVEGDRKIAQLSA